MCKIKVYTDKMRYFRTGVLFRVDYYLRPNRTDDFYNVVDSLLSKEGDYKPRTLTPDLVQLIDGDSCATNLSITLSELMSHPCDIYENAILKLDANQEIPLEIIIHRYFIAVRILDSRLHEDILSSVVQVFVDAVNVDYVTKEAASLLMQYSIIDVSKEHLWEIVERTAFPSLDSVAENGIYHDTIIDDAFSVDVVRQIRLDRDCNQYSVVILTNAVTDAFTMYDVKDGATYGNKVTGISCKQVSQCFTE